MKTEILAGDGSMRNYYLTFILQVLLGFAVLPAMTQDNNWEEDGAIQDAEVVIEKDRQITLEDANRGYLKVSPPPVQEKPESQDYSFTPIQYAATPFSPRIRVNRIKEEPLPKLYGNYIKGGAGNYGATYVEGFFNNKRSETHSLGGYFRSLNFARGPVDKGNSANSEFSLGFDGSFFTEDITFTGKAGFDRNKIFYYGYTPGTEVDKDTIKQIYNVVQISAGLEDRKKNQGVDYKLNIGYVGLGDDFDGREDQGNLNFDGTYQLHEKLGFGLVSDVYLSKRSLQSGSQNRNFFRVRPTVFTNISGFNLEVGLNVVYENDTIDNADKVHVAPVAEASIYITDKVLAYAGISGDVDYRSLNSYIEENPFLGTEVALSHNIKTFEVTGGLRGSLWDEVSFHTGLSVGTYKNMAFFVNSMADSAKFDIIYDTGSPTLVHFVGELGYSKNDNLTLGFRGDFYGYSTKTVREPWGRPTYSLKLNGNYNLYKKFIFDASITLLGGIEGLNLQSGSEEKLDGIFDLNLSVDYLFSSRFSAFVMGKNLISKEYQKYLNYPSRGFTVIAGVSYSF